VARFVAENDTLHPLFFFLRTHQERNSRDQHNAHTRIESVFGGGSASFDVLSQNAVIFPDGAKAIFVTSRHNSKN
jgi:hypothetical protein